MSEHFKEYGTEWHPISPDRHPGDETRRDLEFAVVDGPKSTA